MADADDVQAVGRLEQRLLRMAWTSAERQVCGQCGLLALIRESFALSGQTYGSPRIWKDLVVAGEHCGENRVARLMRGAQISGQAKPRRKPIDGGVRPQSSIAPNVLERDFTAAAPRLPRPPSRS